jgi:opacity protein-like surface antigen
MLFSIGCLLPLCLSAQPSRQFGSLPRWYVGTDAYLRQEKFIINDPGGQVATSDWMWNFSYGFNLGYRPSQWLAIETGIYRFTYANRLHMEYSFFRRSYRNAWAGPAVPFRVFVDPFAIYRQPPKRIKLQLFTGFSWVNMTNEENRRSSIGGPSYFDEPGVIRFPDLRASSETINNHGFNLEGGANLLYKLTNRLVGSATYGYTFGLKTILQQDITYQIDPVSPIYEATQSSKGSGQTLMIGLKYGFGK